MSGERFDELAKELAGGSRRSFLRRMLLLGAAAVVPLGRASTALAQEGPNCLPLAHKCQTNVQCCSKNCFPDKRGKICGCPLPTAGEVQTVVCTGTSQQTCTCTCPAAFPNLCPGSQGCFAACGTNEVFNADTCRCECVPGTERCGGACITACDASLCLQCNPQTQTCGSRCVGGRVCVNGTCQCPTGQVVCPSTNACVTACTTPKVLNENCECVCPPDVTCTAPRRVNPQTCGCECPNTCTAPLVQNPQTCECTCPPAQVQCGARCCEPGQVCCPPGTTRAGSCRGNIGACQ